MRRNIYFVLLLTILPFFSQAQFYNQTPEYLKANSNWIFGGNYGLNFSSTGISTFSPTIEVYAGSAVLSDPLTGDLLFYSGGDTCYNRNFQPMPDGTGLAGHLGFASQGVCIVPVIGQPTRYYVFCTDRNDSLTYSIVDMSLDNGLGDIVPGTKNTLLDTTLLSDQMIAIPGDNCDIWLMVHAFGEPVFRAWHITAGGIDATPVVSNVGGGIHGPLAYHMGTMAISPDRKLLASGSNAPADLGGGPAASGLLLGSFNAATGSISEMIRLDTIGTFGVCFSPDNSKLYSSSYIPVGFFSTGNIQQYKVSLFDSTAIVSSRALVANTDADILALRLYGDAIYCSDASYMGINISRINEPNNSVLTCDYESGALAMGTAYFFGFPNDVVFYQSDVSAAGILFTHTGNEYHFSADNPQYVTNYEWDFGDQSPVSTLPAPTHTYAQPGAYPVRLIISNICNVDTVTAMVNVTSGISRVETALREFDIYPNPAKDQVTISTVNKEMITNLVVSDISGRIVYRSANSRQQPVSFSVAGYTPGIYLVQAHTEKGMILTGRLSVIR